MMDAEAAREDAGAPADGVIVIAARIDPRSRDPPGRTLPPRRAAGLPPVWHAGGRGAIGVSPARLALFHDVLDRQPDQIGRDPRAESPPHFLLDRVGLAADPRREVAAPPVIESRHLGEPRRLAIGDPVADPGFQVGYCQELCLEDSQAAGFSLMPSMKTVPLMTSASSGDPFNDRQLFDADSISL
jgi:hypothetical protein